MNKILLSESKDDNSNDEQPKVPSTNSETIDTLLKNLKPLADTYLNPKNPKPNNEQNNNSSNEQPKSEGWSTEKLTVLLTGLIPLADRYLTCKNTESSHETKSLQTTTKHDRKIMTILLIFLGGIMGALVWLTATEKISGESLLFAVGLTIGYVFALIQKFIFGARQQSQSDEE